jgi:hypothetical protein
MKWQPSEFWAATPYDCLLAAGGLAKIDGKKMDKKLTKSDVARLKDLLLKDKLRNGNS